MSEAESSTTSDLRIAILEGIVARAAPGVHAERGYSKNKGRWEYYKRPGQPITDDMLRGHMNGGPHLGVYPIVDGDKAYQGFLDIDDHGRDLPWDDVADAARRLLGAAEARGLTPWVVRSGSGHGIHVRFCWDAPQPAAWVQGALTDVVRAAGFEVGDEGVPHGKIEVFPKQGIADDVGCLIALPYGRESIQLDPATLSPCDARLPATSPPLEPQPARDEPGEEDDDDDRPAVDREKVRDALSHVPADDYQVWIKVAMALHHAFGDGGFGLWSEWSRAAPDKFKGDQDLRSHWRTFRSPEYLKEKRARNNKFKPVTIGSVFHWAKEGGWVDPDPPAKGKKKVPLVAAVDLLRDDDEWRGVLGYDEFAHRIALLRPIPGSRPRSGRTYPSKREDADDTDAAVWLGRRGITLSINVVPRAIELVAREHTFHPVRDYLRGVAWDGTARVDRWVVDHMGAEGTPLNRAFGKNLLLAAVARILKKPESYVKAMPVFEGPQNMGKSAALAALVPNPEWYRDRMSDLRSKDALEETRGKWFVEWAELAGLQRAEASRVKQFLSSIADDYRPPYGKNTVRYSRQWVGVGTINPGSNGYLKDETGNVRFCPIECGVGWPEGRTIDVEKIAAARDQLWAEAVVRFDAGEHWWIEDEELRREHAEATEARGEDDSREHLVREFVDENGRRHVRIYDVLFNKFELTNDRQTKALQMEIGGILARMKWKRHRCQHWGPDGIGSYYVHPNVKDPAAFFADLKLASEGPARQKVISLASEKAARGEKRAEAPATHSYNRGEEPPPHTEADIPF